MIYHVKNRNYCTFEIIEKNKLPARAYFIPFSQKEKALLYGPTEARYRSDLVTCLSGEWDFRFYKDPKTVEEELDTEKVLFDKVTVPSVWQYTGYLDPMYINCNYPFSFDPPRIPEEEPLGNYKESYNRLIRVRTKDQYNSVGVYRKKFFIEDVNKTYTIAFLGVTPCLDLFVNGRFVGYSEGAHNTAEFLLDEYLTKGENELVAVVHRFSTGSYLEAQDMFRSCGIFRDVLLYGTEKEHISDYEIKTTYRGDGSYDMTVTVLVDNPADGNLTVEFDGKEYVKKCDRNGTEFSINGIKKDEWSAETPNLYTLTIGLNDREYLVEQVGFRRIEIKGDTYYFNGKNVKFFGVNHHDTHPEKGYAMSMEDMEKDIRLMKEYNVNAVRTSHYPPDPVFIRLCQRYGLYVVDEADIETHGACVSHDVSRLSKNPKWKEHYLDRVKRMFFRDRNSCAVAMWSLGNESGGIYCQQYCYDYLKTVTDIPVHYEGACREKIVGFDVVSEMYTNVESMKKRAAERRTDSRRNKPYFLCEYCHAMGLGPGAMRDYVELFLSDDIYMGGCVWEWADHSVYHKDTGNYTYGGDHNEYTHDGCFCVDGMFRPDREPYTSAYVMKTAYRPVRARHLGEGKVEFTNVNRFRSTDYLDITCTLSVGGQEGETKRLPLTLQPTSSEVIQIEYPANTDAFLNVQYREKDGRMVAEEQVTLNEFIPEPVFGEGKATFQKKGKKLTAKFNSGVEIVFDLARATLSSYLINGVEVLSDALKNRHKRGIYPEIYRAPTDNDMHVKTLWKIKGLDRYKVGRACAKVKKDGDRCVIRFSYCIFGVLPIAKVVDEYTIYGDGQIKLDTACSFFGRPFLMPRVGKTLELKKAFDNVRYYGRGEMENYPDMKEHTRIAVFEKQGDFANKMIVPQTGGERCDVRWAEVTNGTVGIRFMAGNNAAFMFNLNHYSEEDIAEWKHIIDYRDKEATYVNIDGFMCGLGSNSCGPLPEKKYRIPHKKPLRYSFVIAPIK